MQNNPINGVWRVGDMAIANHWNLDIATRSANAYNERGVWECAESKTEGPVFRLKYCAEPEALAWVSAGHWPGDEPVEASENVDGVWYDDGGDKRIGYVAMKNHEDFFESSRTATSEGDGKFCCIKWPLSHWPPTRDRRRLRIDGCTDEQAARWVALGEWPEAEK